MDEAMAWENILGIKTTGRDDSISDLTRFPYEPTDYCVLERLAGSGYITKRNTLVDFGCGKGRVDFFLSYQTKCHAIGIEYNARLWERARKNKEQAASGRRVTLQHVDATEYNVPETVDRCFFFNPFSVEILREVMAKLIESYWAESREILLFFYYPSAAYETYLREVPALEWIDTIDCRDLFPEADGREKLLVFRLSGVEKQHRTKRIVDLEGED